MSVSFESSLRHSSPIAILLAAAISVAFADAPPEPLSWRVTVVEVETNKPITGAKLACTIDNVEHRLTTDEQGVLEVGLRPGKATFVRVESPGWWANGFSVIGDLDWDDDGKFETKARDEPHTIGLRPGTIVRGKLLTPNKQPASGVKLYVGVYLTRHDLRGDNQVWQSWDHGQWPNWEAPYETAEDGTFALTVPTADSRSYIRLGTRTGGYQSVITDEIVRRHPDSALVRYAPLQIDFSEQNHEGNHQVAVNEQGDIEVGPLVLQHGVTLRGRVVDAAGAPLQNVHLYTSAKHGPYSGRTTVSQGDGSFCFAPMNPGKVELRPDATLRDASGEKHSNDVQAVFIRESVEIPEGRGEINLTIRALPHVALEFEWIDRRSEKGPIAYYGTLPVSGKVPCHGAQPAWWRGESYLVQRGNRKVLTVKAPRNLVDATIELAADSRVTTSYADPTQKKGPGRVLLGSVTADIRRTIYADEPRHENHR